MRTRRLELIATAAANPQLQTVMEAVETTTILSCSIIVRADQLYNPMAFVTIGLCGLNGPTQEPIAVLYRGNVHHRHPQGGLCRIKAQPDMRWYMTATYYAAQHITAYLICEV